MSMVLSMTITDEAREKRRNADYQTPVMKKDNPSLRNPTKTMHQQALRLASNPYHHYRKRTRHTLIGSLPTGLVHL
jgi:hypothetical protein